MMTQFSYNDLTPSLVVIIQNLLPTLQAQGLTFIPYYGLRPLSSQAILWRQSRPTEEVQNQIDTWRSQGCNCLADALDSVGPQEGPHVTDALPGYSWHNWGQAVDCYYELDGQPCWDGDNPAYQTYARTAEGLGLTAGYNFTFKDPGHLQLQKEEIPTIYTPQQVNDYFAKFVNYA